VVLSDQGFLQHKLRRQIGRNNYPQTDVISSLWHLQHCGFGRDKQATFPRLPTSVVDISQLA
jgi:hypothetical protein